MKHTETSPSLAERLNRHLSLNGKMVIIFLLALVLSAAIFFVYGFIQKKNHRESSLFAEKIQQEYTEWQQLSPDERDNTVLDDLFKQIIAEKPRSFAAQRGYFTQGLMALEQENWLEAAQNFQTLADQWEESYLAPVSLFNAGSALEEAGDLEGARVAWLALIEKYRDTAPDTSETLFNIARVTETIGTSEAALVYYHDLSASFPESRWTNIGKNRILILEDSQNED